MAILKKNVVYYSSLTLTSQSQKLGNLVKYNKPKKMRQGQGIPLNV
jgi:hypothetical protein